MTKLALQTFTIRRKFQTESDIDRSLNFLSKKGVTYLELAYIPWEKEYIDLLGTYLDKYGIKAISSQIKLSEIEKKFDFLVQTHNQLGMKYMAISVIPFRHLLLGKFGIRRLSKIVNDLGERLSGHGIQLLFHHHNYEFIRWGKKMSIDYIVEYFNPKFVQLLSDTYWIRKGSFNIIDFFKKYKSHIRAVHLRGHNKGKDSNLLDTDSDFVEIIQYIRENKFYYGAIEQNTENEFIELTKSLDLIENSVHSEMLGE